MSVARSDLNGNQSHDVGNIYVQNNDIVQSDIRPQQELAMHANTLVMHDTFPEFPHVNSIIKISIAFAVLL